MTLPSRDDASIDATDGGGHPPDAGPSDGGPSPEVGLGDGGPSPEAGLGDGGPSPEVGLGDGGPSPEAGLDDGGGSIDGRVADASVDDGSPDANASVDASPVETIDRCATASCSGSSNDGCCPDACTAATDVDCNGCGNGRREPGETCDPPESCPTKCDSAICTKAHLQGTASACNVTCVSDPITLCVAGDNCCPGAGHGCTGTNDSDCSSVCGNGVKEPGESCEPVSACQTAEKACVSDADYIATKSGDATKCTFSCSVAPRTCVGGDSFCPKTCNATTDSDCDGCGNGRMEGAETCDPPSKCRTNEAACVSTAELIRTSKGMVNDCTYQCDSKARTCVAGDSFCPSTCTAATDADCVGCGNGRVETGEKCDPLSSCPTACPANGCMRRKLMNGGTCAATCVDDVTITSCVGGDGCCNTATCHAGNDSDCSATCGDARDGICPAGCTYTQDADCKLVGGATCNPQTAAQCKSGACVDGKCCTQTCGACSSCTGAGGTCVTTTNADDADSCTGKQTCNASGDCKTKDDQDCKAGADCASGRCSIFYRDADMDNFPDQSSSIQVCGTATYRSGYVAESVAAGRFDCCDSDANAFPGQSSYFISLNNCRSFNYDCDDKVTKQWTKIFSQCASCPCDGWATTEADGMPLSCGTPGTYSFCTSSAGGGTGRTQACK